jgi:hypothetical protein
MIDALAGAKLITVPGVSTRIGAQILVIMVDTPGTLINSGPSTHPRGSTWAVDGRPPRLVIISFGPSSERW